MAIPLRALHPADGFGVGGCAQLAAGDAAEVVGNHVVVANAAGLAPGFAVDLDERVEPHARLAAVADADLEHVKLIG